MFRRESSTFQRAFVNFQSTGFQWDGVVDERSHPEQLGMLQLADHVELRLFHQLQTIEIDALDLLPEFQFEILGHVALARLLKREMSSATAPKVPTRIRMVDSSLISPEEWDKIEEYGRQENQAVKPASKEDEELSFRPVKGWRYINMDEVFHQHDNTRVLFERGASEQGCLRGYPDNIKWDRQHRQYIATTVFRNAHAAVVPNPFHPAAVAAWATVSHYSWFVCLHRDWLLEEAQKTDSQLWMDHPISGLVSCLPNPDREPFRLPQCLRQKLLNPSEDSSAQ